MNDVADLVKVVETLLIAVENLAKVSRNLEDRLARLEKMPQHLRFGVEQGSPVVHGDSLAPVTRPTLVRTTPEPNT